MVEESETLLVCAQLTSGSLEREIYVQLAAENNTAIRKHNIIIMAYFLDNHDINLVFLHLEGIDFIGPVPSTLTFTSGQSADDIQCSNVTILDNSVVEDERSFRIILQNDTNDSRVIIDASALSLNFIIAIDINDSKMLGGDRH